MSKFLGGLIALVLGLLIFGSYDWVFTHQWYVNFTGEWIVALLGKVPAFREFLTTYGFLDVTRLIALLQSLVLSVLFALLFSGILNLFEGLVKVVQYTILGAFVGFMYYALPALIPYVNNQFFTVQQALPVANNALLDVLIWYLPLVTAVFYIAVSERKKQASRERFWFR
ncbi:hypothetical protein JCM19238_4949 [Vibrio ponticus]|uniref:hypothetical protein n=1 Tax=Vibrio rhodolitus TaxID=2231649 RepID=UPI000503011E|nr:hypothetical protein [Vibrio rhodolitus]GAK87339.1 hypothetical protein JCM19238_4949 [Vibrio ponticus]